MHARATELIRTLGLKPHPEGGHYLEVFRSSRIIPVGDGRRPAATHIFFLLAEGEHSRWHRLASDELWQWYEGSPLELRTVPHRDPRLVVRRLGSLDSGSLPVVDVPAGIWQAARPLGPYALVGCTVAPGFDFADFELLADDPEERAYLSAAGVELR